MSSNNKSKIEIDLFQHGDLFNNYEFVEYCLKYNIIRQDTIIGDSTLLDHGLHLGNDNKNNFLQLLLKYKVDVNTKSCGKSPLYIACLEDNCKDGYNIIDKLLEMKANPNTMDDDGNISYAPLSVAIWNKDIDLVSRLLVAKADPNLGESRTFLHALMYENSFSFCDMFSWNGNVNLSCVKKLVKAKTDLTRRNKDGQTVIMSAVFWDNYYCLKYLLRYGYKTMTSDDKYYSMVSCCGSGKDNSQCLRLLLNVKCSPNIINSENDSMPLGEAVKNNSKKCVQTLIRYKANVNYLDKNYKRPLHYAVDMNNGEIIEILLNSGVNPKVTFSDNEINVIDYALKKSSSTIVSLLVGGKNRKRKLSLGDIDGIDKIL